MKILMIGSYYPTVGGAERYLYELCSILSKENRVFILCPDVKGDSPKSDWKVIRSFTLIKSSDLVKKFFPLEYFQNYSFIIPAIFKGKELIKKEKIDVLHVQFGLAFGIVGYWLKKITKKPLILTLHGAGILGLMGFKRFFKPIVRGVLNSADEIIAVSEAIRREANKITTKKINLLYNSVFVNQFHNRKDKNLVLGVGILTKRKNFEILIKAASNKNLLNTKFIIVGDGPEKENLKNLISELNLKNVYLTGSLPHEKVKKLMSECSFLVLPSKIEAFGLVLIEAMACGKPVIGTNIGGIKEIIIHGKNGFLVSPDNSSELVDKIHKLIKDKKLRKKMGEEARKNVLKKFNWGKNIKKIKGIYEGLI